MKENIRKSPYMDYRNSVPFIDLSGFIVKQSKLTEEVPAKSLKEYLIQKKCSTMINLRRMEYCLHTEQYRRGLNQN